MQILPLILFGIATAFSPGPNNIMTSYTAFNFGFRKAIPTMLGVIIGWTLLIIVCINLYFSKTAADVNCKRIIKSVHPIITPSIVGIAFLKPKLNAV